MGSSLIHEDHVKWLFERNAKLQSDILELRSLHMEDRYDKIQLMRENAQLKLALSRFQHPAGKERA